MTILPVVGLRFRSPRRKSLAATLNDSAKSCGKARS
jgi:hypothetical protein